MLRTCIIALILLNVSTIASARDRIKGPAFDLSASYVEDARVDMIDLRTKWIKARPDFEDSFQWQVGARLRRCARGSQKLTLRVRIDEIDKADLIGRVFKRDGHEMAGAAEFLDRKTNVIVGRYYFDISIDAGGPLKALIAEPEFMLSEAFGNYLCSEVFKR